MKLEEGSSKIIYIYILYKNRRLKGGYGSVCVHTQTHIQGPQKDQVKLPEGKIQEMWKMSRKGTGLGLAKNVINKIFLLIKKKTL